jgi:hypothetical protein
MTHSLLGMTTSAGTTKISRTGKKRWKKSNSAAVTAVLSRGKNRHPTRPELRTDEVIKALFTEETAGRARSILATRRARLTCLPQQMSGFVHHRSLAAVGLLSAIPARRIPAASR